MDLARLLIFICLATLLLASEDNHAENSRNHKDTLETQKNSKIKSRKTKMTRQLFLETITDNVKSKLGKEKLSDETLAEKSENFSNPENNDTILSIAEEDVIEAANFGLQAMNDLYFIKEPDLYTRGLFLRPDNPAVHLAKFNEQGEEAKKLARFGYAALEATKALRQKYSGLTREVPFNVISSRSDLHRQCPKRGIPRCLETSLKYRTADGSCNNPTELWWGSALSSMQRFVPPFYQDSVDRIRLSVTGLQLPSAREVSQIVHEDKDVPVSSVTHMLMQWGQFIDHDITATGQNTGFNGTIPQCCLSGGSGFQPPQFMHPECLPISVNPMDRFFGRLGIKCLEFIRSGSVPKEDCGFGPREQLSQVTSFIDGSHIYGSSSFRMDSLRTFRSGFLKYGRRGSDACQRGSVSTSCFQAGDLRFSEQPGLTSLHTVFLRYHNKIASQLAAFNRHWNDEKTFQETRKIIGAILQIITYREFLPLILGSDVMRIFNLEVLRKAEYYSGYDPSTNPSISNEFSTAAYRFGHSLVQRSFHRFDKNHLLVVNNVSIHKEFSHLENLQSTGSLEKLILGLTNQPCQRADEFISTEMTNHLFQGPNSPFGLDLASLNIQRGRDHGLGPYVSWREPCGLSPIRTWEDMKNVVSPETVEKFQFLYASVEDVDLYPAGLAEKPVTHGLVGPTFACIIAQQFSNLRNGDRFWFENSQKYSAFSLPQLEQIRKLTLAHVLCRALDNVDTVQPYAFLAPDQMRNKRRSCNDRFLNNFSLRPWKEQAPKQDDSLEIAEPDLAGKEDLLFRAASKAPERLPQRHRPLKTKINQQNRIVVKRPLGPNENLTIFVQNNAVNAPVFVSNAQISNSNIHINQASSSPSPVNYFQNYENQDFGHIPRPIARPKPYYSQNPWNNANFNVRPDILDSLYSQLIPHPDTRDSSRDPEEFQDDDISNGRLSENDGKFGSWEKRNESNLTSVNSSNTIRMIEKGGGGKGGLYYDGNVLMTYGGSRREKGGAEDLGVEGEEEVEAWESSTIGFDAMENLFEDIDFLEIVGASTEETGHSSELPRPIHLKKTFHGQ